MDKKWLILLPIVFLIFLLLPDSALAKSGCCSWHGGVSGCDYSTGRQVCNDGTYSPSCTCAYIPQTVKPTPIPTRTPTLRSTIAPTKFPTPKPKVTSTRSPSPIRTSTLTPTIEPDVMGESAEEPQIQTPTDNQEPLTAGSKVTALGALTGMLAVSGWVVYRIVNRFRGN